MSETRATRIGRRVAELRKIHGATQIGLAQRANVSESAIRKIESGERVASPAMVAAIARALSVNVTDITEQPYGAWNASPESDQAAVPAVRQALVEGEDPDLDVPTRAIDELRAEVSRLKEWDRRTSHAEVIRALPDLLRHLHRAHQDAPTAQRAMVAELLASTYCFAVIGLYRLGHLDLAHLADERARRIAADGDDPLRAAAAEWHHALILLCDGSYRAGLRTVDRAEGLVDQSLHPEAARAIRGALHLRASILAARMTDTDLADVHLAEAHRLADPAQEAANFYGTKFSPRNVDIHRVAVPVEMADGTTAVSRAAEIRLPSDIAPSRSGHYWIDLSRGWLLHGDRQRALEALNTARGIAPLLTRYHPQVHETVQSLANNDSRMTVSLARFAAWCGIRT
ncbi:XRE family transcriptional regulator [Kribbella pittospori]|uniref:XRE family transcriptional regulator n=1 Tax=Kribbella pittospori TaxID=722689 RepID=A0A4R0L0Z0_9ACTN|nr:helix-turn-helix transcriptional regulator [Kribbella pittospori]TCC64448.1 XRE family transcriptional regulator [Kribbella pittospori]